MIGKYPAKLDDKNRLFVPAKLRSELGNDFFVTLGVNCGHRCLTVYTDQDSAHLPAFRRHQPYFHERHRVQPR